MPRTFQPRRGGRRGSYRLRTLAYGPRPSPTDGPDTRLAQVGHTDVLRSHLTKDRSLVDPLPRQWYRALPLYLRPARGPVRPPTLGDTTPATVRLAVEYRPSWGGRNQRGVASGSQEDVGGGEECGVGLLTHPEVFGVAQRARRSPPRPTVSKTSETRTRETFQGPVSRPRSSPSL